MHSGGIVDNGFNPGLSHLLFVCVCVCACACVRARVVAIAVTVVVMLTVLWWLSVPSPYAPGPVSAARQTADCGVCLFWRKKRIGPQNNSTETDNRGRQKAKPEQDTPSCETYKRERGREWSGRGGLSTEKRTAQFNAKKSTSEHLRVFPCWLESSSSSSSSSISPLTERHLHQQEARAPTAPSRAAAPPCFKYSCNIRSHE